MKKLFSTIVGTLALVAITFSAAAVNMPIAWDFPASKEADISGFKVWRGISSGSYTVVASNIADPTVRTYVIDIPVGTTYYMVVRSYQGPDESGSSNEIAVTGSLPVPTNLRQE